MEEISKEDLITFNEVMDKLTSNNKIKKDNNDYYY